MRIRNDALENSLRCLGHPVSLLSIALLLLNDHVFKVISPSWLTGKLSDFAGLFFFPFIIAAALSLLLSKFNFKPRVIGQLSFTFVALCFLALKTTPFFNTLTSDIASFMVGHPTLFTLDWSDVFGLAALLPGWKLWNQIKQQRRHGLSYVALSIGIFASIATSPAQPTVEAVTHLWKENDTVFAYDVTRSTLATSQDGGKTWEAKYDFDYSLLPNQHASLPIVICAHGDQKECYRVNGEGIVEDSEDAGKSWKNSWELPADRITYINRANPGMDLGPHDLIIIQWSDREYVLAAVGEEGVLRKELPDGEWEQIQVENAAPTLYRSANVVTAISLTFGEIVAWFLLSILAFHISCALVWSANFKASGKLLSQAQWIYSPASSPLLGIFLTVFSFITILIFSLTIIEIFGYDNIIMNILSGVLSMFAIACLGLIPGTIQSRMKKWQSLLIENQYPEQVARTLAWLAYLTHVCVFLIGGMFWIMWAMGVIARYDVALLTNLISTGLVASIFYRKIRKLSKQSVTESKTSGL